MLVFSVASCIVSSMLWIIMLMPYEVVMKKTSFEHHCFLEERNDKQSGLPPTSGQIPPTSGYCDLPAVFSSVSNHQGKCPD